jgi:hypothetical protein
LLARLRVLRVTVRFVAPRMSPEAAVGASLRSETA